MSRLNGGLARRPYHHFGDDLLCGFTGVQPYHMLRDMFGQRLTRRSDAGPGRRARRRGALRRPRRLSPRVGRAWFSRSREPRALGRSSGPADRGLRCAGEPPLPAPVVGWVQSEWDLPSRARPRRVGPEGRLLDGLPEAGQSLPRCHRPPGYPLTKRCGGRPVDAMSGWAPRIRSAAALNSRTSNTARRPPSPEDPRAHRMGLIAPQPAPEVARGCPAERRQHGAWAGG
jgi:hypothetical protein